MITPVTEVFSVQRRQQFRQFFQPSRVVIGVFVDRERDRLNAITLCFNMHCSYKPPMMAFSIQRGAYSYGLLEKADTCVLAVPGENLANQALYCGVTSAADAEKFETCGLLPVDSKHIEVPGIRQAIANVELRLLQKVQTGDHLTGIGQVLRYAVNVDNRERCLLSVGPRTTGYKVLCRKGLHRIAVIDQ